MEGRYTVENKVGRVIEARVFRLSIREDADGYGAAIAETLNAAKLRKAVLCADHRAAGIYPPPVADRLVELFRPNNTRFERIALVVAPSNATLYMQLERLTREAGGNTRRVFQDAAAALEHLSTGLEPAEVDRLRVFLAEPSTATGGRSA